MKPEERPTNNARVPPDDAAKNSRLQAFRQHLRETDKYILERRFDKAWLILAEAAKLEPNHPMLIAFKERLELAQQKAASLGHGSTDAAKTAAAHKSAAPPPGGAGAEAGRGTAGELRQRDEANHEKGPAISARNVDEEVAEKIKEAKAELETLRKALETECAKGAALERELSELKETEQALRKKYDTELADELERQKAGVTAALEAERKFHEDEKAGLLDAHQKELDKIRSQAQAEMEKKLAGETERVAREYERKLELLGLKFFQTKEERVACYREKLRVCYANGQASPDDEEMLADLRELLKLTPEEHSAIASDVRLGLYVEQVKLRIKSGELNITVPTALDELKKQFAVTPEESSKLEPYILSALQQLAIKGKILLVDDDQMVLTSLSRVLTDYGFQVTQSLDIKNALEKLQTASFDFILSDIKFASGELDGFKFFETIAEQPQLRSIPFVFMSALRDKFIVRSGARLGADDFLEKPVEPDMLIAVIEGKMKRFNQARSKAAQIQSN